MRMTNAIAFCHLSVSGYLAEIDRMQLEVREYLQFHPAELTEEVEAVE